MNFGPETDEKTSYQIMDAALDMGINFFYTANVYGWKIGEGITEQIVGPRTMDQLSGSFRALEIDLEPEFLEKLDTIWPGPGGPAPEAYAW